MIVFRVNLGYAATIRRWLLQHCQSLLVRLLLVSLHGRCNFSLEFLQLFRWEPINELDVGHCTLTNQSMPDAVVNITLFATNHWKISKIRAIMALMGVFSNCIRVFHDLYDLVVLYLTLWLDRQSCIHFCFHEDPLPYFEVGVVIKLFL